MSNFCPYIDQDGICSHMDCPDFLCQCSIPYDEYCPMGCNNPDIEEDE